MTKKKEVPASEWSIRQRDNARFLDSLPEGRYYDGTYEWDHGLGDEWEPILAPYGMPSRPERAGLKIVKTRYESVERS